MTAAAVAAVALAAAWSRLALAEGVLTGGADGVLVRERHAEWRYWSQGPHATPAARENWMQTWFDDGAWPVGKGVFGFGEGYEEPFSTPVRPIGGSGRAAYPVRTLAVTRTPRASLPICSALHR
jgi:hypothetical protein